jgi:hypothetical protein
MFHTHSLRSNTTRCAVGLVAFLAFGVASAKDTPQTTRVASLATPAGCVDSPRGRTHVLRFCGEKHYWIKRKTTGPATGPLFVSAYPSFGKAPETTGGVSVIMTR